MFEKIIVIKVSCNKILCSGDLRRVTLQNNCHITKLTNIEDLIDYKNLLGTQLKISKSNIDSKHN